MREAKMGMKRKFNALSEPVVKYNRGSSKWEVYNPDYHYYGEVLASFGTEQEASGYARAWYAEQSRSERSRESDERLSNADTIEPDDPRVDIWKRDPGRADIAGIDTPTRKRKIKSPAKRRPHSVRAETQVRGVRR